MYSMVLFIVDTSFSGFAGSGPRPTAAVRRYFSIVAASALPVKVT